MKKLLMLTGVMLMLAACNSNSQGSANDDPNEVHPVSETIPDSMKLANDSVIVPDAQPGNGSAGAADTPKNPHEGMNH